MPRNDHIYDAAIIGGGVMGCTTALHLARGGMDVVVFERGSLCREASGRNAGPLTLMYTRASLVPYTARGRELWATTQAWLGGDGGFHNRAGLELALDEDSAADMERQMRARAEAGAPIEIVGANRAREIEPALTRDVTLAAYCAVDGSANSNLCGALYRRALARQAVEVLEDTPVETVETDGAGFVIRTAAGAARARRLVLASGAWIGKMGRWFGLELPVTVRLNQGTIMERLPPLFDASIRVTGQISLKQTSVGTVLIGGGAGEHWIDDPDRADTDVDPRKIGAKMVNGVRTAARAIPALGAGRVVRTWIGAEGFTPDNLPMIGPLPGVADAYVIGCQRSGFTTGPFMGKLLAEFILEKEPEMPILRPEFDPRRLLGMEPKSWDTDPQSA